LRVAIDARRFQDRPLGGVGRSIAGVVDLISDEADVVLVTDARRPPPPSRLPQVALGAPARAPEIAWLQWSARRWRRGFGGVFHGTFNQLPIGPRRADVVTIHDLSFEVHPEGFTAAKRRVFQAHARHAARVARQILVPSEHTRTELVRHYRVDPARVHVTPWGVEPRFDPSRAALAGPLLERLGVRGRFVVAMGGAPRRGVEVAIAAWRRLRAEGADVALVVVGGDDGPGGEPGLVRAGRLDDAQWADLLAAAAAFCYPTRYEGFGIPALESVASGTPVVCAPVASLPEVLGDAAQWCTAPTAGAVADGLRRVLDDGAHAQRLVAAGLARAARHPTWADAARVQLKAYRLAAEE
jgi:alpha-1,3-rhamnosyl/mannosyltransferase